MLTNRWKKAQKAETVAWESSVRSQELTEEQRSGTLAHLHKYTSLSGEQLENMRILEIGGAYVERAFDSVSIPPKLVLDPLLPFRRWIGRHDKSCHRIRSVGEYLPLRNNCMDLCWCANTIDHTSSPVAVLSEINRVLDDKGMLVISCNTFPPWTRPLLPLLNILDKPHPHHFTLGGIKKLLKREFLIQKETEVNFGGRTSQAQTLKYRIAAIIGVRHFYFRCIPTTTQGES